LHVLRLTLAEFEQASRAFVDDVFAAEADTTHTHEELIERGADRRAMTATIWAESGDAEIASGTREGSVVLGDLLAELEACVGRLCA
jgi:hypothetical protein